VENEKRIVPSRSVLSVMVGCELGAQCSFQD
jgi:hypothetical protein